MRIVPITSNTKRPCGLLDSAGRFFALNLGERAARWLESFPWGDARSRLAIEGETPVGFVAAIPLAAGQQVAFLYLDEAANTPANALLLLDDLSGEGDFLLLALERLSVPASEMTPLLMENGWEAFHRQRHRLISDDWRPSAEPASGGVTLRQVEQSDLPALAFLQATTYHGSRDALVYPPLAHPGFSQQMLEQWQEGRFGKPLSEASILTTVPGSGVGGFVLSTEIPKKTAFIVTLAVSPRHRGRGLARQLMNRAITACFEAGYSTIELTVSSDNHAALGLYESLGFRRIAEETVYRQDSK
ncbi:GNAT family N-acetyltransferase [bacterium]|nr:GNAT family N-acetyltransferase [bacterium]